MKKVSALGGAPLKLADATVFLGGSWSEDGFIVAEVNAGISLMRIPEAGGAAEALLPTGPGTTIFPQVLPGGKKVIFGGQDDQGPAVQILSLDTKDDTKKVSTLIPGAQWARYLPTGGANGGNVGHIVYPNGSTLMAAPFDPVAGELRGQAVPVLDDVAGLVGFSSTGDVLYTIGAASDTSGWPLRWLRPDGKPGGTPDGKMEPLLATPGNYTYPRVSPDGKLLAVTVDKDRAAETRLIVYDWQNDRTLPLTEKGQVARGRGVDPGQPVSDLGRAIDRWPDGRRENQVPVEAGGWERRSTHAGGKRDVCVPHGDFSGRQVSGAGGK